MSESVPFGYGRVPPERKQAMVDGIFHSVAPRYDLMNDLMSGGLHRVWKDAMVSALKPPARGRRWRLLDAAGGTGDIARRVARRSAGHAEIVVLDASPAMLAVGRQRMAGVAGIRFCEGSAEAAPFADGSFDAYSIAFGLRNVPRLERALAEAHRILRHGGHFLCLEFSQVDLPLFDRLYDAYSFRVIPPLGGAVAGDADAYRYLVESIRTFPDQERLAEFMRAAGFAHVRYRNFSGGIAALHSGWKL